MSIVINLVSSRSAKARNSQAYAEQSLLLTNTRTDLESTSNSRPLKKASASACNVLACSKVKVSRRRYPARMFRNSLRHSTGAAHSGSCYRSASAAAENSHGRYKYARRLESTTIMRGPAFWLHLYLWHENSFGARPHATHELWQGAHLAGF